MASVFKRQGYAIVDGKRVKSGKPFFVAKFNSGQYVDGVATFKQKSVPSEHCTSKFTAQKWADQHEYEQQEKAKAGIFDERAPKLVRELLETWKASLTNRNADDDRSRADRHITPAWGHLAPRDVTLRLVLDWIDKMKAGNAPIAFAAKNRGRRAERLSGGSMRANVNLLSRFCSWCVERGTMQANPVRLIPQGRRPIQAAKSDTPWISDDKLARNVMHALPAPYDLMFYLGNRSGLRLGEICGLRMSDLAFLDEGVIRVRFSYDGPLKEDKRGEGKIKWVPAADDCKAVLADWLAGRRAAEAGPEDYTFPNPTGGSQEALKQALEGAWDKSMRRGAYKNEKKAPIVDLSFYQATRHSFTSRSLAAGASLDEVSSALGHSSPIVTKRYYDHFVRRSFSSTLRAGLGMGVKRPNRGKVVALR